MLNPKTHNAEYPASYYAASWRYPQRYAPLEAGDEVDVCIVGGGFSGINTAIELAERGQRVAVLEAQLIGWGASGRNGGQLIRGIGHGLEQFRTQIGQVGIDSITQMGFEAVDIVIERIKKHNIACDLQMGYCDVANRKRHLRDFDIEKKWLDSIHYPYDTKLLSRPELADVVGSDRYLGGLTDMGSGHVHPLNLITGEAQVAEAAGVQIYERSAVTPIGEGGTCVVHTEFGKVTAQVLVLCANAYVQGLHPKLDAKILPCGSYMIATEPLTDELCRRLLPANMAVCDQRVAVDYYRLSADKRLLFGGRCNYSGRDPRDIKKDMYPDMLKVFPYLKGVHIEYQWGGLIGIGANRLPQIGRLKPNIYYAQAYAGHGLNASHMAARLIAESITAQTQRIEVFESVKHLRFPGGQRFRSPILALGMSWFRFLDLL